LRHYDAKEALRSSIFHILDRPAEEYREDFAAWLRALEELAGE